MSTETEVVNVSKPMFFVNGKQFRFVRFEDPDNVVAWKLGKQVGEHVERLGILKIDKVDISDLKIIGIWDRLDKDVQDNLIKLEEGDVIAKKERMDNARKYRRGKYPGVPHEVECVECKTIQKMSPGQIVKNAEKWALKNNVLPDVEKWIRQWRCQECFKTPRGRKSTGKCKPIELHCSKCKNTVTYPTNILQKRAEKKGITLEKLISGFICQCCSPCHRGRPKKSK